MAESINQNKHQYIKNIPPFFKKYRVPIYAAWIVVVVFGFLSVFFINFDLVPDIESPGLIVVTEYPNATPEEVKNVVTVPIERAVYSLKGIRSVSSISRQSFSIVKIRYKWGQNLNVAHIELREKLDLVVSNFPREITRPTILNIQFSQSPMYAFVISTLNDAIDPATLYLFAKHDLSAELERIRGVSKALVIGGSRPQVNITVDPLSLIKYKLMVGEIRDSIMSFGNNRPVGFLKKGNREFGIKFQGEITSYLDYENIVIKRGDYGEIRVKDIGSVEYGVADKRKDILLGDKNVLALYIFRQRGINALLLSRRIKTAIDELSSRYGGVIQFEEVFNNSDWIRNSLKELGVALFFGILFTIFAIWIWLRNIKLSLLIIATIPISIVGTFILMKVLGISINVLTLSGFILAIGMIVDNAVIVVTSALKGQEDNRSSGVLINNGKTASEENIKGSMAAVVSATLTTIVVFVPVIFLSGVLRVFFMMLSLIIVSSLLISLIASVTLIPVMLGDIRIRKGILSKPPAVESILNKLYEKLIKRMFKKSLLWIVVLLIISSFGFLSYNKIDKRLMAPYPQDFFYIKFFINKGVSINYTENFIKSVTRKITVITEIDRVLTVIGEDPSSVYQNLSGLFGVNSGVIKVYVKKDTKNIYRVIRRVKEKLNDFNNVNFVFTIPDNPVQKIISTSDYNATIMVYGSSDKTIKINTDKLYNYLVSLDDSRDALQSNSDNIVSSFYQNKKEYIFSIKREYLPYYDLTAFDIAAFLKMAVSGINLKSWRRGEYEIPVKLMMDKRCIENPDDILNLGIVNNSSEVIAISELLSIGSRKGNQSIFRENQKDYGWIGINENPFLLNKDGKNKIVLKKGIINLFKTGNRNKHLKDKLDKVKGYCLKNGIEIKIEDQFSKFKENSKALLIALLLSIFLEYIILVVSFKSFLKPLIVIGMIPISLSGVIIIIMVTGSSLNINSFMSIIVLIGLLVNNAIMLFLEYRKKNAATEDDIIMASVSRLKPIMITTLSTILALLPGAFTSNRIQASLSLTLILGLFYSTGITLIYLPLFYRLLYVKK